MDKCEFCGAPAIPMQHCLCDEAVALVRELDAKLRARYYPAPATTEPPEWKAWHANIEAAEERAWEDARDAPEIARALSTPLPHDPDMHTRVMPWRGKE